MYDYLPFWLRCMIGKVAKRVPHMKGKNFLIRHGMRAEDGYIGVNSVFNDEEMKAVCKIHSEITNKDIAQSLLRGFEKNNELNKRQIIDIQLWLEKDIFLKGDRMSMANSLECRVPYSDIEVYNIARKLTVKQKVNRKQTKILLRKAYENDVKCTNYNKKKLGFPVPLREWIKDKSISEDILKAFDSQTAHQFFDTEYLKRLFNEHFIGKRDNYKKIWVVYIFILWYQIYFENLDFSEMDG